MQGKVKFVDAKTGSWGFIIHEDGGPDIHFVQRDVTNGPLLPEHAGLTVEFDVVEDGERRHARRVRRLECDDPGEKMPEADTLMAQVAERRDPLQTAAPGEELTRWAYVVVNGFVNGEGKQVPSVLPALAALALRERWHFGDAPDPRQPFTILDNYLRFTFFRLRREGKIAEIDGDLGAWAAFNTGLVDELYDPIYALFKANDPKYSQPWRFDAFCVPGKGPAGKRLTSIFDPLPAPASYFKSNFDMLLDADRPIHVDYDHVILDGIGRDRFPPAFLERYVPRGFSWQDYTLMDRVDRTRYLDDFVVAVDEDLSTKRAIKRRLEDAKLLAEKRTRWNYKTAIPQYFPREDSMSLLLPLAITDDEHVDLALVVTRNPSGSYQGRTVFPLDWAYKNARLVCRPDSDWLVTDSVTISSIGDISAFGD